MQATGGSGPPSSTTGAARIKRREAAGPRHSSLCLRPAQLTLYCSFGAGGIGRRRVFKRGMTPINWRCQIKGVASRPLIKSQVVLEGESGNFGQLHDQELA